MVTVANVPKGYKKTEGGIIPEDWDVKEFGDIAFIRKQKYDSKKQGAHNFCVELEHIEQKTGRLIGSTETSYNSSLKNVFIKEDVLFGRLRAYLRKYWKAERKGVASSEIWVLVAIETETISGFIFQVVQTKSFIEKASEAYGTHMPRSDWTVIKRKLIPLPPTKAEQKTIATVLSDTDELVAKLEELIKKKRNIKQGTMQELLTGKKRLPGFSGEWEEKKLGDFLCYEQPTKYLVADTEYSDDNHIPVLTAGKTFILGYTNEEKGVFGDGLPVIIFDDFTTATKFVSFPFKAKSSAMKILKPKNKTVNLKFIFEKMQLIDFPLGDHKRYWISEYQHISIQVPKPEEQSAIAQVLSDMDAEIEELEQKLDKYRAIKQGMMQELLTGKTRLA